MKTFLYSISAAALISVAISAQPAGAVAGQETGVDRDTKSQKPKRITDRRHPDYVRCRLEPIIGSLAKKRRVCMTNQQWAAHIQEGNRRANQFVSDMDGGIRMDVP